MASLGLLKYVETKLQTTCFHLILSLFKKKKRSGTSLLPHFLHNFWRNIFLLLYSINWPNFIVWLHLLCDRYWVTCALQLFVNQVVTSWFLKLKSNPHLPKLFIIICFNHSPSKMMKNALYFILKALFVLKIFKFLSWLFGHVGKTAWLER